MSQLKSTDLINDISLLIEQSQQYLATQANSTLTLLFWKIGRRINDDILQNKRAEYGKQIVATVATQLEKIMAEAFRKETCEEWCSFRNYFRI